jgi:hypothetical protein
VLLCRLEGRETRGQSGLTADDTDRLDENLAADALTERGRQTLE